MAPEEEHHGRAEIKGVRWSWDLSPLKKGKMGGKEGEDSRDHKEKNNFTRGEVQNSKEGRGKRRTSGRGKEKSMADPPLNPKTREKRVRDQCRKTEKKDSSSQEKKKKGQGENWLKESWRDGGGRGSFPKGKRRAAKKKMKRCSSQKGPPKMDW